MLTLGNGDVPAGISAQSSAAKRAEAALTRAQWQPILYAKPLRRLNLLGLQALWPLRRFRLQVIRNQPFEFVASVLRPFLQFAGLEATVTYSDYDDSLSLGADPGADVLLLWLDFERYSCLEGAALSDWLTERLKRLRQSTTAPIMVASWASSSEAAARLNLALERLGDLLPGLYVLDQAAIARSLGAAYRDERTAQIAGTTMSDLAALETARLMGLCWLPALLLPPLKAIAVDFDGTLYAGVLGEDGPRNLLVSPEHMALQRCLLALRHTGIFLAAVTRNLASDVESLFRERTDLPLRREDFSAEAIGWAEKGEGIQAVADALRIGADSVLFIDDNPGELASVAAAVPGLRTLHAAGPGLTLRALDAFPGLFRWRTSQADAVRLSDHAALSRRKQILEESPDSADYLRALQIQLGIAVDEPADVTRLHELSQKTNQFNTSLRRFTTAEVARYQADPNRRAVSISLRDRLSDSGIVAALFIHVDGDRARVEEISISCRALGRGLERLIILAGIERALAGWSVYEITFPFQVGPRNQPAREFLSRLAGNLDGKSEASVRWVATEVRRELEDAPVDWKGVPA